jgi:molybdate transport repressor ModE-like protein
MLDARRLKVLLEVSRRGSFSAAADSLSFTQSAVSQQIAALEREAGTKLLDRRPGGVHLTDAGRALVRHAEVVLARLADAERELAAIASLEGGRVRLASFPSAGATLVTEGVALFSRRHPQVELRLAEGEPDATVPALKAGEFDVAVVFDYTSDPRSSALLEGLDCIHLLDDPLRVVVPGDHKLARRKAIALEQLADEAWVASCSGSVCNQMIVDICAVAGFQPNIAFESDDYNVLMGLVAAGVGLTLLPELAIGSSRAGVEVRAVAGSRPLRRIYATVPAAGYRSPAIEAMIEVLESVSARFREATRVAAA